MLSYTKNSFMLGIFDSGFGGLTVLREIHRRLPHLSTLYLGDNARAPYGDRSQEEIFQFALEGLSFLFAQGCPLVIFACNTASAHALRRIQQTILPIRFPDRRVLGVTRPTVEYLAGSDRAHHLGIFATQATVDSRSYELELHKLLAKNSVMLTQVACPGLTNLIEAGKEETEETAQLVKHFVSDMLTQDPHVQRVLLACTHYPLIKHLFGKSLPKGVDVLTQGEVVAQKLETYLERHPEMMGRLNQNGMRKYCTTSSAGISQLATRFYGSEINFEQVNIHG
ncbi:TPA: glutamate racemase [Candidatus Uhrbacteria bacterium]|uniref:Glutamate racemase n=2 Tax=Candidatus Uhriibacteriota TaxID=1752732 RepID=A0A0G1Q7N4_9BACT|nr:MAG: Glutamate racemase [Candidatus Uhrbacteria bacterium GW2011_GWF2_46_218]KKU40862.1 MAG: Glutamate racemase [Candidatus Uhrbacteria bacterium GW2011_GWE2_46_68]HBK33905.1 glutamate racemase [Candidatus Uhrbacteria bacterium]HCB19670.1 glutamate racemase [Candidatus Uhrbacteria bacterium]